MSTTAPKPRYIGAMWNAGTTMPTVDDLKVEIDEILAECEKIAPPSPWAKTISALNRRNAT
ncbi:hypothetical protein NKG99_24210 [Mesorhizobium sp. M1409]|uniref:hypothetical protein n=1 Tax=unclassified Mesorhizobium TaxID=325217 RepID=UPI00333C644D